MHKRVGIALLAWIIILFAIWILTRFHAKNKDEERTVGGVRPPVADVPTSNER